MKTAEELLRYLEELGIDTRTYDHPPVFTVEQAKRLRGNLPGAHCKNLFLRDKKRNLWLVSTLEQRTLRLRELRAPLGARKSLSLASPELLREALGVDPGSVTPFALVNDVADRVGIALDRAMLDENPLNFHPLRNDRTTAISPEDLLHFIRACRREPVILDFDRDR